MTNSANAVSNRVFTLRQPAGNRVDGVWNGADRATWAPAIDLIETAEAYHIYVDLPGVGAADVNLTFERNTLVVQGRREPVWQGRQEGAFRMHAGERFHGDFTRTVRLPEHVDAEAIEATFGDGVLTVTVPKAATAQARRIPVQGVNGAQARPERN